MVQNIPSVSIHTVLQIYAHAQIIDVYNKSEQIVIMKTRLSKYIENFT